MAGTLTLDSWPGPTGFTTASYFDRFLEQMQFGFPSTPGVLPSRVGDILGNYTSEFRVIADSSGMQVKVAQGRATAKGVFAKLQDAAVTGGVYALTVTAAHATLQRVDRVVVSFDLVSGGATLRMVDGTAATTGTAVPTALTQSASTWHVPLALVIVDPTVTTIAPVDVIDVRQFTYTVDTMMRAMALQNPVINGGMSVWNDGTTLASVASGTTAAECWKYVKSGSGVHTISRDTDVPSLSEVFNGALYSTKLDVTTADSSISSGDVYVYDHRIEGRRFHPLAGKSFSLPFWIKSPKVGVHCVAFTNSVDDRSWVAPFFVEQANTWERHVVHVDASPSAGTWNYDTGIGLRIVFTLAAGSTYQTASPETWQTGAFLATSRQVNTVDDTSNNVYLAAVGRLSLGGLDLPFAPHNDEQALCERYYETVGGELTTDMFELSRVGSSTVATTIWVFRTRKRAVPTLTVSSAANWSINDSGGAVAGASIAFGSQTTRSASVDITVASGLTAGRCALVFANSTADARFRASARL